MRSRTMRVEAIIGSAATIINAMTAIAVTPQMLFLIIDDGMILHTPRSDADAPRQGS